MRHEILEKYLLDIEKAIQSLECYIEKYEEEFLNNERVNPRIRLRFKNGYLLEINEAIVVESQSLSHLAYRYHFQKEKNDLIFRYDNTPHFPHLDGFPHHLHN